MKMYINENFLEQCVIQDVQKKSKYYKFSSHVSNKCK